MKKITVLLCAVIFSLFCPLMAKADAGLTEITGGDSLSDAAGIKFDVDYVSSKDDTAYFMFTTPDIKAFYYLYLKNYNIRHQLEHAFGLTVQNKYGENIAENLQLSSGREGTVNFKLEPDTTYYIRAVNVRSGNFQFRIAYKEDIVGDTAETSKGISLDKTVNGSIDGDADQDWYHFTAKNAGDYVLSFQNLNMPNGIDEVYAKTVSSYGEDMGSGSWINRNKGGDVLLKGLSANTTYYVQIATGNITGNYRFSVSPKREAPSAESILKLKKVSKTKFKVAWKKNSKATGYEIQYGTDSTFSSAKTKKVKSASTTNTTVSGLEKGKTYYVRVRAYISAGTSRLDGIWSDIKSVRLI